MQDFIYKTLIFLKLIILKTKCRIKIITVNKLINFYGWLEYLN